MANPTEIRVTFTVDLKPYAMGLQTMLSMTQAAGKQIVPILNFRAKPDLSVFDQELKKFQRSINAYMNDIHASADVTKTLGDVATDAGIKIDATERKIAKKGMTMRTMKRESLEAFGALAFLAQGVVRLASETGGGSREMEKLNDSLAKGITAGFGLAGILAMLNIATGGIAVAIGGLVAVGTTMLAFFDNSAEAAQNASKRLDIFRQSLAGASLASLKEYRDRIVGIIVEMDKNIAVMERARIAALKKGNLHLVAALEASINDERQRRAEHSRWRETLDEEITRLAAEEENKRIEKHKETARRILEIEAETAKASLEAQKTRQLAAITNAEERSKIAAIFALQTLKIEENLALKLASTEKKTEEEKQKIREKYAALRKKIMAETDAQLLEKDEEVKKKILSIEAETEKAILETHKNRELAIAQSAREKVVIEERYALKVIDLEEQIALAAATSQEERVAIAKKFAAQREKIRSESSMRFLEAEKQDKEAARRMQEEMREEWRRTHEVAAALMDGMTSGFEQMFGQILVHQRQAKDEWDAAWLAMKNSTLQAIAGIMAKKLAEEVFFAASEKRKTVVAASNTATRVALNSSETASALTKTAAESASGTAKAAEGAAGVAPFPLNIVLIAAAIAAAMALFKGITKAFGFARGGRLQKGQVGFFEGIQPELIAPERDFYQVARTEMIPRLIVEQARYLDKTVVEKVTSSDAPGIEHFVKSVDRFERAIDRMEKMEWEISGRALKTVIVRQNRFDSSAGIKS